MRLVGAAVLVGLACAALAIAATWLSSHLFGTPHALTSASALLRDVLVVLPPGGLAGLVAIRSDLQFETSRGAFWTVVGAMGFMGASLGFARATQVVSLSGFAAWVGAWLVTTLLIGAPLGWWASRL
jgi:hypothetical protein